MSNFVSSFWLPAASDLLLAIIGTYALLSVAYCLAMLISAAVQKRRLRSARSADGSHPETPTTRFCILIPAHNESVVIAATIAGVRALDYPPQMFRCVVIADNCDDDTALLARTAWSRTTVLERAKPKLRGKGYALNWALAKILPERDFDAVVIIDADTQIDPMYLRAMDREIRAVAEAGQRFVAQGLYQVYNTADNWRTALMAGALSLVHYVRPLAREGWGVSAGLKGNGMCFAAPVLAEVAWRGESLTEDLDYGLDLIESLRIPVRFVPDAVVRAQMPTDSSAAQGQRRRWEGGRSLIVRRRALALLWVGMTRFSPTHVDAALDLMCPPLAQLGATLVVWGLAVALAAAFRLPHIQLWTFLWACGACGLIVYVVGGFRVGDAPPAAYRSLLMAAFYVPWKIGTLLQGRTQAWNRTARKSMDAAPSGGGAAPDEPARAGSPFGAAKDLP